jgi:hypothetical protein
MTRKSSPSADDPGRPRTAAINNNLRLGLDLLWQSYCYSQDASVDVWDFALEIDKLYATGLTISDLRWLVAKGFVEHGQESSVYGTPHRTFRSGAGFFFGAATCVVLTPEGAAFVGDSLNEPIVSTQSAQPIEPASSAGGETAAHENMRPAVNNMNGSQYSVAKPQWLSIRRELRLDDTLVKRFRVPARNQEVILSSFEDEGWPEQIDDPLPVRGDVDPQTRLHDAINRLNRAQTNPLIRFSGNGSGTGVSWKVRRPVALH